MKRAADSPHSKFNHVYPILRVHFPFDQTYPTNSIAVVKVLTSQSDAEGEVLRLNRVNSGKNCVYLYCTSRLIERADNSRLQTDVANPASGQ